MKKKLKIFGIGAAVLIILITIAPATTSWDPFGQFWPGGDCEYLSDYIEQLLDEREDLLNELADLFWEKNLVIQQRNNLLTVKQNILEQIQNAEEWIEIWEDARNEVQGDWDGKLDWALCGIMIGHWQNILAQLQAQLAEINAFIEALEQLLSYINDSIQEIYDRLDEIEELLQRLYEMQELYCFWYTPGDDEIPNETE